MWWFEATPLGPHGGAFVKAPLDLHHYSRHNCGLSSLSAAQRRPLPSFTASVAVRNGPPATAPANGFEDRTRRRPQLPAKLAVVVAVTETQLGCKRDALRQNPITKAGQLDSAAKVGMPEQSQS